MLFSGSIQICIEVQLSYTVGSILIRIRLIDSFGACYVNCMIAMARTVQRVRTGVYVPCT